MKEEISRQSNGSNYKVKKKKRKEKQINEREGKKKDNRILKQTKQKVDDPQIRKNIQAMN